MLRRNPLFVFSFGVVCVVEAAVGPAGTHGPAGERGHGLFGESKSPLCGGPGDLAPASSDRDNREPLDRRHRCRLGTGGGALDLNPSIGRLPVIETVVPDRNQPPPSKLFDVFMMLLPDGMERNEAHFGAIFESSGFKSTGIRPTESPVAVTETRPVWPRLPKRIPAPPKTDLSLSGASFRLDRTWRTSICPTTRRETIGERGSHGFQPISPSHRLQFNTDRVLDEDHRWRLELESGSSRAELVNGQSASAEGRRHFSGPRIRRSFAGNISRRCLRLASYEIRYGKPVAVEH